MTSICVNGLNRPTNKFSCSFRNKILNVIYRDSIDRGVFCVAKQVKNPIKYINVRVLAVQIIITGRVKIIA